MGSRFLQLLALFLFHNVIQLLLEVNEFRMPSCLQQLELSLLWLNVFRHSWCPLCARVLVRGVKVGAAGDIWLAAGVADVGEEMACKRACRSPPLWQNVRIHLADWRSAWTRAEPALESPAEAGACALGSSLGSGLCCLGKEGSAGNW